MEFANSMPRSTTFTLSETDGVSCITFNEKPQKGGAKTRTISVEDSPCMFLVALGMIFYEQAVPLSFYRALVGADIPKVMGEDRKLFEKELDARLSCEEELERPGSPVSIFPVQQVQVARDFGYDRSQANMNPTSAIAWPIVGSRGTRYAIFGNYGEASGAGCGEWPAIVLSDLRPFSCSQVFSYGCRYFLSESCDSAHLRYAEVLKELLLSMQTQKKVDMRALGARAACFIPSEAFILSRTMNRSLFFKDKGCAKNALLALAEDRLSHTQITRLHKALTTIPTVRCLRGKFAFTASSTVKRCPVTVDCAIDKEFNLGGYASAEEARLKFIMGTRSEGRAFLAVIIDSAGGESHVVAIDKTKVEPKVLDADEKHPLRLADKCLDYCCGGSLTCVGIKELAEVRFQK